VEPEDSWTGCECVTWVCRVCVHTCGQFDRTSVTDTYSTLLGHSSVSLPDVQIADSFLSKDDAIR
jgi:hypothetical protein